MHLSCFSFKLVSRQFVYRHFVYYDFTYIHNKGFKWFRRPVVCVKTTTHYNQMLNNPFLAEIEAGVMKRILFIHYGDLYSAPSRLLLRSAPDPCTAKKKSFETRV